MRPAPRRGGSPTSRAESGRTLASTLAGLALLALASSGAPAFAQTHGGIAGTGLTLKLAPCEQGDSTKCIFVARVTPGSSAEIAGLAPGQRIVSVGPLYGEPALVFQTPRAGATKETLARAEAILDGPGGTSAVVTIWSGADYKNLYLPRGPSGDIRPWCTSGDCENGPGTVTLGRITWTGTFEGGRLVGDVTMPMENGTWVGPVEGWIPSGKGTFTRGCTWTGTVTPEVWGATWAPYRFEGVETCPDGTRYEGSARGDCDSFLYDGRGKLTRAVGGDWEGEWFRGSPTGSGVWVGLDVAGRPGTYSVAASQGATLAGSLIIDGPAVRTFGLVDPSSYHPGCAQCLNTTAATLSGPWTESGSWGHNDGAPFGVHQFTGPNGAHETIAFGGEAPPFVPDEAWYHAHGLIAGGPTAEQPVAGPSVAYDLDLDGVGAEVKRSIDQKGGGRFVARATTLTASAPENILSTRCPGGTEAIGFVVAVRDGTPAPHGSLSREWHGRAVLDPDALHFEPSGSGQGWTLYTAERAGGDVPDGETSLCTMGLWVTTPSQEIQEAFFAGFYLPLR